MTCAACVRRVEKKLGKLAGVTASVNLATGLARVSHPAGVAPESLVAAVEQAGYQAALPVREDDERSAADGEAAESRRERERLTVTALLAVPVLVLSMVPALQFRDWQWLCFVLAAPVAVWSAWPFHVRALRGMRHSAATMDTLVSLGTVASFTWSAYALFLGGAGGPGMRMPFSLLPSASDGGAHLYLEAAVSVPLFVLTGRFLEGHPTPFGQLASCAVPCPAARARSYRLPVPGEPGGRLRGASGGLRRSCAGGARPCRWSAAAA